MKSAGELEAAQKYSDAIATLQHAKSFANDQSAKSVDEKLATLKGKLSQGSLFEMDTNPQPPTNNNAQANQNGLTVTSDQQERDFNPAYAHSMPVDFNAHREGEYDQYPDFPGHSNTKMFNY